ncbi:MAG: hypothetical protein IPM02_26830 [Betaproteobacteria bacterium]|nr:hypothetical protein [Betaproteobacteria bacterium]
MCFSNAAKGFDALIEISLDKNTYELLAWYVNGTLAGTDRDQVEAALKMEAGASSLLAWEKAIQGAVKNNPAFEVAADRGLHQTMQRIQGDTRPAATLVATPRRAAKGGWFSGLSEKIHWSPAMALACGVVAVQFAVIAQMWTAKGEDVEYAGVRTIETLSTSTDAFIRITFKPQSREGDLSELLRTIRAEIVAGPSQLGDYYLLLAKNGSEDVLNALQKNALVESAEFANALPTRP